MSKSVIVYGVDKITESQKESLTKSLKLKTVVEKWSPSKGYQKEGHLYLTHYTNPKKVNGGPSENRDVLHLKVALEKAGLVEKPKAKAKK